jgi:hypothetical protein
MIGGIPIFCQWKQQGTAHSPGITMNMKLIAQFIEAAFCSRNAARRRSASAQSGRESGAVAGLIDRKPVEGSA